MVLCGVLSVEAQTDSVLVSASDWRLLLERVEQLEKKTAQLEHYPSLPTNRDKRSAHVYEADAHTGATRQADAYTGATRLNGDSSAIAQTAQPQTQRKAAKIARNRLTIGGYGEAVMSRNFYSDHFNRYIEPDKYKDYKGNGQFDLPHVVVMLGYDFGRGWSMGTEIEFEHGGTESAVEIDADESGEYEAEVERGGEVALEQFWINKEFFPLLNLRMGEIIVPIGMTNARHLPTQFFTCYRNEGEMQLFPCTWHQLGVELWGKNDYIGYQAMFLAGLDAERFSAPYFVHYGVTSPYEFKIANSYAGAVRVDGYIPNTGLRLSVSGYAGASFHNTQYSGSYNDKYKDFKGMLYIGAFDFEWQKFGVMMRGNIDYAYLGDADKIWTLFQYLPKHSYQDGSPRTGSPVSSQAICGGVQLGYDVFHYIPQMQEKKMKLIPFVVYEYYNPVFKDNTIAYDKVTKTDRVTSEKYSYMNRHRIAAGINFYPIKQVVIKAEYSKRFLPSMYNDEASFSLSVAYSGIFKL